MPEYKNTTDILGDDATLNAILTGTITEYRDTGIETIAPYAFAYCPDLAVIDLPSVETIGLNAFTGCTSLTRVRFPKCQAIQSGVFEACTALKIIDLPVAMRFDAVALKSTSSVTAILLRANQIVTMAGNAAFWPKNAYIYVPSALVETYKISTGWANFADQFRALESYTVDGTVDGELDESKIGGD